MEERGKSTSNQLQEQLRKLANSADIKMVSGRHQGNRSAYDVVSYEMKGMPFSYSSYLMLSVVTLSAAGRASWQSKLRLQRTQCTETPRLAGYLAIYDIMDCRIIRCISTLTLAVPPLSVL